MVKYRTDDVVFASMDAQLYVDFCVGVGMENEERRPSTFRTSRRSSSSRLEATSLWERKGSVRVEACGDSGVDSRRRGEVPPTAGGRRDRTVIRTWRLFVRGNKEWYRFIFGREEHLFHVRNHCVQTGSIRVDSGTEIALSDKGNHAYDYKPHRSVLLNGISAMRFGISSWFSTLASSTRFPVKGLNETNCLISA